MNALKPPDPNTAGTIQNFGTALGTQQQGANVAAQTASNYDMVNPYGSTTFEQTGVGPGGVPTWTSTVQMTPAQQALLNTLQGTQQTAGGQAQALLTGAGYGNANPAAVIGDRTSGLTGDLVSQQIAYYKPWFDYQRSQLDTQLKNQGFKPGDPAYDMAMKNTTEAQNATIAQAATTNEVNAFNQATTLYGLPANIATALAQFGAPGSPTATNVGGAALQPANFIGATGAVTPGVNQQFTNQQSQYAGLLSGASGIGSAMINALPAILA